MSSYNQVAAGIANIFQQGFTQSLAKSSGGIGGLGGIGGGVSTESLINSSIRPGTIGSGGFMTNPSNPLQGIPALQGLGQFVQGVQTTGALRQAGILPSTKKGAQAQQPAAGLGGLASLAGLGGLAAMGGATPQLAGLGGGIPQADISGGLGGGAAQGGGDPMQQLMGLFLTMMSMAMSMTGSQQGGGGIPAQALGGGVPQQQALGGLGGLNAGLAGLGGIPQQQALGGLGGGIGQAGLGGLGGGGGGLFAGINSFAGIDAAINKTLGSIANTLPLARVGIGM